MRAIQCAFSIYPTPLPKCRPDFTFQSDGKSVLGFSGPDVKSSGGGGEGRSLPLVDYRSVHLSSHTKLMGLSILLLRFRTLPLKRWHSSSDRLHAWLLFCRSSSTPRHKRAPSLRVSGIHFYDGRGQSPPISRDVFFAPPSHFYVQV